MRRGRTRVRRPGGRSIREWSRPAAESGKCQQSAAVSRAAQRDVEAGNEDEEERASGELKIDGDQPVDATGCQPVLDGLRRAAEIWLGGSEEEALDEHEHAKGEAADEREAIPKGDAFELVVCVLYQHGALPFPACAVIRHGDGSRVAVDQSGASGLLASP